MLFLKNNVIIKPVIKEMVKWLNTDNYYLIKITHNKLKRKPNDK